MTAQQPEAHIKEPYTLAEIKTKIASNDYNAEMLLQHAMLLLDGAALSANVGEPVAWYEYNESLDTWFLAYSHNPKAKTRPLVFGDGTNNLRDRKPDTQADSQPAPQGEPWYGHHFKEVRRGYWQCSCGKVISEAASTASKSCYPPLPRRHTYDDDGEELFTADQMHAYGEACWKDAYKHAAWGAAKAAPTASVPPEGWKEAIADVRSRLEDDTPSAFDNSGYRSFASSVLDSVEEELDTLAAAPKAESVPVVEQEELRERHAARSVLEKAIVNTPQPVVREPLTDEQIARIARSVLETPVADGVAPAWELAVGIARAIESAHGIGIKKGDSHG